VLAIINVVDGTLSDEYCHPTHETLVICPESSVTQDKFSLTCPDDHTLTDLNATAYRRLDFVCPTHDLTSACLSDDLGRQLNDDLEYCEGLQNCLDVQLPVTFKLERDACVQQGVSGIVYFTISYRCQPKFSGYFNGSAWAIAMQSSLTRSASMININSLASALMGNFVNVIDTFCSVTIPAGLEVTLRPLTFIVLPQQAEGQCVEIMDRIHVHRVCSKDDEPILLGCADTDRTLKIVYRTNDERVGVVFVVQIQVSHTSRISATCGVPINNLLTEETETEKPKISKDSAAVWNIDYDEQNETALITNSTIFARIIQCGGAFFGGGFPILLVAGAVGGFVFITTLICVIFQIKRRRRVVFKVEQRPALMKGGAKPAILPYSFTPIDGGQKQKLIGDAAAFEHI